MPRLRNRVSNHKRDAIHGALQSMFSGAAEDLPRTLRCEAACEKGEISPMKTPKRPTKHFTLTLEEIDTLRRKAAARDAAVEWIPPAHRIQNPLYAEDRP